MLAATGKSAAEAAPASSIHDEVPRMNVRSTDTAFRFKFGPAQLRSETEQYPKAGFTL